MAICCGGNWEEVERHLMEQEATRKINEEARIENEKKRIRGYDEIVTKAIEDTAIKYHDPIQWNIGTPYVRNEIVFNDDKMYISKLDVPAGIEITNGEYWQMMADNREIIAAERDARIEADAKRAVVFDTVADMKASEHLKAGMTARTNGFHEAGDGGAAWYQISDVGVPNDADCFLIGNGLYALEIDTCELDKIKNAYSTENKTNSNSQPLYTPRGLNVHKTTFGQYANASGMSIICNDANTRPQIYGGDTANISKYHYQTPSGGETCGQFIEVHTRNAITYSDITYNSNGCSNPSIPLSDLQEGMLLTTSDKYFGIIESFTNASITLKDGWYKNGVAGIPSGILQVNPAYKAYLINGLMYVDGNNAGNAMEISVINESTNNDVGGMYVNDLNSTKQSARGVQVANISGNGFLRAFNSRGNSVAFHSQGSTDKGFFSDIDDATAFVSNKDASGDILMKSMVNGTELFSITANGYLQGSKLKRVTNPTSISRTSEPVSIFTETKNVTFNIADTLGQSFKIIWLGNVTVTITGARFLRLGIDSGSSTTLTLGGNGKSGYAEMYSDGSYLYVVMLSQ